jgi:hypothetical protein
MGTPVQMELDCPACGRPHVDRDGWEFRPHRRHLCEFCLHEWRPHSFNTVGIEASDRWLEILVLSCVIFGLFLFVAVMFYLINWSPVNG